MGHKDYVIIIWSHFWPNKYVDEPLLFLPEESRQYSDVIMSGTTHVSCIHISTWRRHMSPVILFFPGAGRLFITYLLILSFFPSWVSEDFEVCHRSTSQNCIFRKGIGLYTVRNPLVECHKIFSTCLGLPVYHNKLRVYKPQWNLRKGTTYGCYICRFESICLNLKFSWRTCTIIESPGQCHLVLSKTRLLVF